VSDAPPAPPAALERLLGYYARRERLVVGLMSGMSMDGLDLALVRLVGAAPHLTVERLASTTRPYDPALKARLRAATQAGVGEVARLGYELAARWAEDVLAFLAQAEVRPAQVDALASHGQTVFHLPRAENAGRAVSLQVGAGAVLAERTGLLTVSDFRPRDIAAGGEGAPLIPYADWCLWARRGEVSAAVNLGSIANVTVVTERVEDVLAFDVGPANALIDGFAREVAGDHGGIDRDGRLSAAGRVVEPLLAALDAHARAFLDAAPPRSAGFQHFGPEVAARMAARFAGVAPHDRVRTAVEWTARTLADGFARFVRPRFPGLAQVRVSGGGTRNPTLMARIAACLAPLGLRAEPLDPTWSEAKEAIGFALLGDATLRGLASNVPGATGASHAVPLGQISLP
jgi:anhydro-N-acetylmuramic acid kinase